MSIIRNNKNYGIETKKMPVNNQNKTITANGIYIADAGYDGLGTVTVDVPDVQWPTYLTVTYVATDPTTDFQILNNTTGIDSYRIKGTQTWLTPTTTIQVGTGEVVIEYQLIDRTTIPAVFNGIGTMSKVEIPSGVTTISGDGFYGCTNLVSIAPLTNLINVPWGVLHFTKVGFDKLYLDGNRNWQCTNMAYTPYYVLVDGRLFAYMNMNNQSPTVVDFSDGIDGHTITEVRCNFMSFDTSVHWNPSVIKFPSTLTSFDIIQFAGCTIGDVYFYGTTPPSVPEGTVFNGATITGHIYVPAEAVSDYQNSGYFSDVADKIQAMP